MESAKEGEGAGAACVVAGELERGLDGLGAAIGEEDSLGAWAGRETSELLRQNDLGLVGEVCSGHVDETI